VGLEPPSCDPVSDKDDLGEDDDCTSPGTGEADDRHPNAGSSLSSSLIFGIDVNMDKDGTKTKKDQRETLTLWG
jgi:hypothetical protein